MHNGIWTRLLVPAGTFLFLILLASLYGYQFHEDAYQHFQTSVEAVAQGHWTSLLTDTWNKPLPALIYGFCGQWGLTAARMASVVLTFFTGWLIFLVVQHWFNVSLQNHPWTWVGFFLFQLAVLPQSFLTMTELIAAFLWTLGIFLHLKAHPKSAFFVLGLLPLARLEMSLIMAWTFLAFSWDMWRRTSPPATQHTLIKIFIYNGLGALPLLAWWMLGWRAVGSFSWLLDSPYSPYVRPWGFLDWMQVNSFTGLGGVLSAPALFLFWVGLFSLPKMSACQQRCLPWLYGPLLIHGIFMSLMVVYPADSRFADIGIAAINARNYNVLAPLITIFVFAGALGLQRTFNSILDIRRTHQGTLGVQQALNGNWNIRRTGDGETPRTQTFFSRFPRFWLFLLLTEGVLLGFYAMQQILGTGLAKGIFKLALHQGLLIAFILWLVVMHRLKKTISLNGLAWACILGFFFSVPLFWHPLKFYEQRYRVQQEFCDWFHGQMTVKPVRIVQDMNGRLDRWCDITQVDTTWTWANQFLPTLQNAPAGTLAVLETNAQHQPHPRYPEPLIQLLNNSQQFRVHVQSSNVPPYAWETLLNRLSSRNAPLGWLVFVKN